MSPASRSSENDTLIVVRPIPRRQFLPEPLLRNLLAVLLRFDEDGLGEVLSHLLGHARFGENNEVFIVRESGRLADSSNDQQRNGKPER